MQDQPGLSGDDYRVLGEIGQMHRALRAEIGKRIIGQHEVIDQVLTAFFAGGHVLLLGVPGLAKTLLISTLAEILGMKFNRIQFTPDLMPSDITGSDVLSGDDADRSFKFMGGPIFANFLLADEINRTPPKTQAALLEAMEENTVTVAGQRYELPRPYFVMATQNPIEQEGTYVLPVAALDRFMFTVLVDYPNQHEEMEMLYRTTSGEMPRVDRLLDAETVVRMLDVVRRINVRDDTLKYAIDLIRASRPENKFNLDVADLVECGGSPRATQALILGAKSRAALEGRDEALPDDIRAIALPAMHHRILTNFHAEADSVNSRDIVRMLIRDVPRPAWDMQVEEVKQKRSFSEWMARIVLGRSGSRPPARRGWDLPERATRDQKVVLGPAPFAARNLASAIDQALVVGGIILLLLLFLQAGSLSISGIEPSKPDVVRMLVVLGLASLALLGTLMVALEAKGGTPGKRLLGLRVMTPDGESPGVGIAVARVVLWQLTPPLIDGIAEILDPEGRALHDMLTRTTVVKIGDRADWVAKNTVAKKLKATPA